MGSRPKPEGLSARPSLLHSLPTLLPSLGPPQHACESTRRGWIQV